MLDYWVNFANTGNPNSSGLVNWPQFQSSNDCYLEIKATPNGSQCGLRTAKSDLWDAAIGYVPCSTSVGINELEETASFGIYPNPTTQQITVVTKLPKQTLQLYNTLGVLIRTQPLENENTTIDLSNFTSGMYIIKVGEQTQKIIKE